MGSERVAAGRQACVGQCTDAGRAAAGQTWQTRGMPLSAFALLAVFIIISSVSGIAAWLVVGPPAWWAAIGPVGMTFVALYVVGHRLELEVGPRINLFGYDVALLFDIAVAVVAALVGAALVRLMASLAGATA